jgi:hypothetical protein
VNPLDRVPYDKAKHYLGGTLISLVASLLCIYLLKKPALAWQLGLGAATLAGVLKEGTDWALNKYRGTAHGVEFYDALATALGGLSVALPLIGR